MYVCIYVVKQAYMPFATFGAKLSPQKISNS